MLKKIDTKSTSNKSMSKHVLRIFGHIKLIIKLKENIHTFSDEKHDATGIQSKTIELCETVI